MEPAGARWSGQSPFVMIFSQLGIDWAAHLLNFIILTAALSVYNSGMYANSRMLYGLAQQGNAPKVFMKVNKQGTPIPAVLFSAVLIFGCVLLNYFVPEDALSHLIYIVVGALVLNWAMISLTHLKFIQTMKKQGIVTKFPALFPCKQYTGIGLYRHHPVHHVDTRFSGICLYDSCLDRSDVYRI